MWIIVSPKKDYDLTEFIVNILSLCWEYQLQINFSVQRLWINGVLGILWWVCYVNYFARLVVYIIYITYWLICEHVIIFIFIIIQFLLLVLQMYLTNFKIWKEAIEIALECMDLDLALRTERPTSTLEASNEVKIEKWDRSNRMCIMVMKRSIP